MIGEPTFHATARFEDGEARIRVTAVRPYGDRSTSTTIDVEDETVNAKIQKVFESAIKSVEEKLSQQSFGEAARAVTAAFDRGENLVEQLPHVRVADYDDRQKAREATAKRVQAELGKTTKEK